MVIELRYTGIENEEIGGAFIRGCSSEDWLKQISEWNLPLSEMACFIMPEGLGSVKAAGLFVIFRKAVPARSFLLQPYHVIANRLFIPSGSDLWPSVSQNELESLLIWDVQVMHPTIGFVGFEFKDLVQLSDLVETTQPLSKDWSRAKVSIPKSPQLTHIEVYSPSPEEVLEELKSSVDTKPLDEISKQDKETSLVRKMFDGLALAALKAALAAANGASAALTGKEPDKHTHTISSTSSPSLLDKLHSWMLEKVASLEQKRADEISRLLTLFENNPDEALQFAIPLNSPYLNRGRATPTTRLIRNNTSLNLRWLGGGKATDVWDLGDHYHNLNTKYRKAAALATDQQNYDKAAYIYAHLLGDYTSAANVLEQGRQFRKAAILYKEHLKNIPAAADCLERGGLIQEAVELYLQLNQPEKAADLFVALQQPDKAEGLYRKIVNQAIMQSDFLEAARLLKDKLKQPEETLEILLTGWDKSHQAEACLKQYFEIIAETESGSLPGILQNIYKARTPVTKKKSFLHVMAAIRQKYQDPELEELTQAMAFEIISEQVSIGNNNAVQMLKTFVPDDKLLSGDSFRYLNSQLKAQELNVKTYTVKLKRDVKWMDAVEVLDQILVIGISPNHLFLARCKREGQVEYTSWPYTDAPNHRISFLTDPDIPGQVWIIGNFSPSLDSKSLQVKGTFNHEVQVKPLRYRSSALAPVANNSLGGISTVSLLGADYVLSHYNKSGNLVSTFAITVEGADLLDLDPDLAIVDVYYRNNYFYLACQNKILQVSMDGKGKCLDLGASIIKLTATAPHSPLRLLATTDQGCLLIRVEKNIMEIVTSFFAQTMAANLAAFVPASLIVVSDSGQAVVYDVLDDNPKKIHEFNPDAPIIAVLPSGNRNEFVLMHSTGRLTWYHSMQE